MKITELEFRKPVLLYSYKRRSVISNTNRPFGLFICHCGKAFETNPYDVKYGNVKSCGCLKILKGIERRTTHEYKDHPIYSIWKAMRQRCLNPRNHAYKYYGNRGITICKRWDNFINFKDDMLPTWENELSIDRINNNGNYEPGNCRWLTRFDQMSNTSRNIYLTLNEETKHIAEWARIFSIDRFLISHRILAGWSHEDAITIKPQHGNKSRKVTQ